jgi:hypothetical protein
MEGLWKHMKRSVRLGEKRKKRFSPVALAPALGRVDEGGGKSNVGPRVEDVGLRCGWGEEELGAEVGGWLTRGVVSTACFFAEGVGKR